eukprot:TRINITY_DN6389_c0_g1_i1.p1 TRINITY_DN6389_c0_g1~~TRINITY_DN6389_c0_g1_i1.p1  ORF type:complete len:295 (-),score=83.40 TRINITY_DN6389_c0_g1_i1:32-805(-)
MQSKYKDQDEEERELRMALLGAAKAPPPTPTKQPKKGTPQPAPAPAPKPQKQAPTKPVSGPVAAAAAAPEATETTVADLSEKSCFKCGEKGHLAAACPSDVDLRKEKQQKKQKTAAADLDDDDDDSFAGLTEAEQQQLRQKHEAEQLAEIDSLTAVPVPEDVLLFAVPVCAPYSAMGQFKYKVKLQPGSMKKGKAVKSALEHLLKLPITTPVERDLLKALGPEEMAAIMISDVKMTAVAAPSGSGNASGRKGKKHDG